MSSKVGNTVVLLPAPSTSAPPWVATADAVADDFTAPSCAFKMMEPFRLTDVVAEAKPFWFTAKPTIVMLPRCTWMLPSTSLVAAGLALRATSLLSSRLAWVAAASWAYLGKSPGQLTHAEAALLAVLPARDRRNGLSRRSTSAAVRRAHSRSSASPCGS